MKKYNYIVFLFIGIILIIIFGKDKELTNDEQFWCIANIVLTAFVLYFEKKGYQQYHIPYISFWYILIVLPFGVSPYFVDKYDFQLGLLNFRAVEIGFYFNLLIYLFYRLFLYFHSSTTLAGVETNPLAANHNFSLIRPALLVWLVSYSGIFKSISGLDELLIYSTTQICAFYFLQGKLKGINLLLFFFLFVFESITRITSGLIFVIIYYSLNLVIISFAFWRNSITNTLTLLSIVGAILVFSILFSSVKSTYRSENNTAISTFEKLNYIVELITTDQAVKKSENTNIKQQAKEGPMWRLSYPLSALSLVIDETPNRIPYWEGESYWPVFTKFIPRAIWENKPKENMGQVFGHRYGILASDNLTTSINTPIYAEAYMNFGYWFIPIFSFLFGFIMFKIQTHSSNNASYFPSIDFYFINCFFIYLSQFESNFSMMVGKFIVGILVLWAIKKFVLAKK